MEDEDSMNTLIEAESDGHLIKSIKPTNHETSVNALEEVKKKRANAHLEHI